MNKTKQDRIDTVNKIIVEIADRGRGFFNHENETAYMLLKNNRIYMVNEWNGETMPMKTKFKMPPKHFHHGGTLWGLCMDFEEFISKGGDVNHNNGHGGLYCLHWGYPEEDMTAIQDLAKELGYLK